jgi:hypothetical protein
MTMLLLVCFFLLPESFCEAVMFQQIPNWYVTSKMRGKYSLYDAVYKEIVTKVCGNTYLLVTYEERERIGEQIVTLERAQKEGLETRKNRVPHHYFELTKDSKLQLPACKATIIFSRKNKAGNFKVTILFEKLDKKGKWQQAASLSENTFTQNDTVETISKTVIRALTLLPFK